MEQLKLFVTIGCLGVLVENIFTGLWSLSKKDYSLTTTSYLWMFPIYGLGAFLINITIPLTKNLWHFEFLVFLIELYIVEYFSGYILKMVMGKCPWDYSEHKDSIHGFVRVYYAPAWLFLIALYKLYFLDFAKRVIQVW